MVSWHDNLRRYISAQGTTSIGSAPIAGAGLKCRGAFQLGTDGGSSAVTTGSISTALYLCLWTSTPGNLKYKIYNNNLNEKFHPQEWCTPSILSHTSYLTLVRRLHIDFYANVIYNIGN